MYEKFVNRGVFSRNWLPVILTVLIVGTAVPLFAQVRPFDYKGDTQRVPGEILLTLKAGKYEIKRTSYVSLGEIHRGEIIEMEGFNSLSSPGDPVLPFRIYEVAVPPNIDWETIELTLEEVETVTLPGVHTIPPAPPMRARVDDEELVDWGRDKDIVKGRNMNVYGKNQFFPAEPATILSRSQMRKWKFIRLGLTPLQYNPVTGRLQLIKSVRFKLTFKRIGTKVFRTNPLLRDTLMDDEARKRFINFKQAVEWYRYVPPSQSEKSPKDPDYVIITTNAIQSNSTKLTDFVTHKTSLGHTVQIVTETNYQILTGQPPNGTAEKIRQWLIDNYVPLGIHYVLLIGDPDPDDPSLPADSVGDLPMKMCWPYRHGYSYYESPTDYFYADLTGNWDLDGDGFYGEDIDITNPITPDPAIDPDTFSVRWTGRIEADVDGLHLFATSSDDGIRVIIDGNTIINNWTDHLPTMNYGSINLTAGQHDITVEFYENTGEAVANLYWLPPGAGNYYIVPSSKLYHLVGATYVSGGLDGEYFNNTNFTASALTRVDNRINFYWGTGDRGPGGVDFDPELYVGRIPVYNADYATLDGILQKIIDYETVATPAWRRKFLTANVYLWDTDSDWQLGEALKNDFADPLGFTTYRVYESDFGLVPPPECPAINPPDTDPAAPCNMLQQWANGGGYGLVTWSTHGSPDSASQLIASTDCSSLDDTTPAFTFQGSCLNGYPENSDNLGYSLLEQGAIATVSASRVSWNACFDPAWDPNPASGTNANLTYHYAMRIMKDSSSGHALYITKANVNSGWSWMNKMDYNIYGDPSSSLLRLYGGVVLLFDTSGSMSWRHDGTSPAPAAEQRISLAKEAAYPFMELLNDHSNKRINFGIATFPPHPWSYSVGCNGQVITPMTLITNASKNTAVTTTIPGLVAEGNTPLLAGMSTSIGMFGLETNRAIALLSDGYHNCPSLVNVSDPEVTNLIAQLNTEGIKVFTIGFGRPTDVDHPLLEGLATGTGGTFYDVTTPSFDPLTWDPATDLQATYKAILADTLGLETATDPMGVIKAGETVTRQVKINEHDQRVSFFLSWVTPQKDRLGLKVKSSDGQEIPITYTTPGVHFHEGNTYKVLTVDRSFLNRPGKVAPTPWKIEIDSSQLDSGEREHYQYSVILDSALKMKTAFDKTGYGTGDTITLSAKISELGQPMTNLTDVYVTVTRPGDGAGNWFALNKVSAQELKRIPEKRDNENLSPLQRKAMFLTDIRKVAFPGIIGPATIPLYDDGSHGDVIADDGTYTNRFTDTVKEGTYSFHFHATGPTSGGNAFDRDDVIEKYISVKVLSKYILVDIVRLLPSEARLRRFKIVITPKDALGNYLGPRYSGMIKLTASRGDFINALQDNLDGTYSRTLQLPTTVDIRDVEISVDVKGETLSFNLAEKLEKPYRVSFHVGRTIPIGNFKDSYDSGYISGVNVDYQLTPQLSVVGLLMYNSFKAGAPLVSDTHWWNISANLKYRFTTNHLKPYVNAGLGIYIPESGSTRPGLNVGFGADYPLKPDWTLELAADYHHIFTSGNDIDFLVPHVGLLYRF
jgi:Mg-chelatase subunit ChlD